MGSSSMKVHQFTRAFWEQDQLPSLTLGHCKRLRPLAPKLTTTTATATATATTTTNNNNNNSNSSISTAAFDLKSFIRPESGPRKLVSSIEEKRDSPKQVETHPGGTRWNPTQEQIGILEALYRSGTRTPNAQQIEQITAQLGKYGKIEGKNVFYWFQNHKARERQKQKRNSLGLSHCPRTVTNTAAAIATITLSATGGDEEIRDEDSPYKRKCRSWGFEFSEEKMSIINEQQSSKALEDGENITLELFPLHPEGR